MHLQRAIGLCHAMPGAAGVDVPRTYVRTIDALDLSGDNVRARAVAEEAYRRFGDHPDRAAVAVICQRVAHARSGAGPAAMLPLIKEALRLFAQTPPSADHARAWLDYGTIFIFHGQGRLQENLTALNRALEIAEAAGATTLISRIVPWLAYHAFVRGQVEEGLAMLQRGQALAGESGDGMASLDLAVSESDALLKAGQFDRAAGVAMRGLRAARQAGLEACHLAETLAANAAEALLARGRTAEAAALIDPLTSGPPDRDHWFVHEARAEIGLLRGDIEAATRRWQEIRACVAQFVSIDTASA